MRNKKLLLIAAGLCLVALLFWIFSPAFEADKKSKRLKSKSERKTSREIPFSKEGDVWFFNPEKDTLAHIDVEMSRKPYETARGLMDRSKLGENQGMIFIFKDMRPRSFWMKNTKIPLDIIYIDNQFEVVSIQHDARPYSEASLPSKGPAQYVVEVNSGFCKTHGIDSTSSIFFLEADAGI